MTTTSPEVYRDEHRLCPVCQRQMQPDAFPELNGRGGTPRYTLPGGGSLHNLRAARLDAERMGAAANRHGQDVWARSPPLVIVILFWTPFEVLMEQFFEAAFADDPENK
ncbi:MAG: hypothetical protein E5W00_12245, partial [Mesorhizobium sp.]